MRGGARRRVQAWGKDENKAVEGERNDNTTRTIACIVLLLHCPHLTG